MSYDKGLAQRVREQIEELPGFDEKKMFGGICFLLRGNMAFGVLNDELIVRVGADAYEASLKRPGARQFDFTGRPMKGWVIVSYGAVESDDELRAWIMRGIGFANSLPPK